MRYGPNLYELDPAIRRKPQQSLKKAAPGAPFGWNAHNNEPYIGTRYAVRGTQFASVSTRNGSSGQYYWKSLSSLSAKVALSAVETHGTVEKLWAGESRGTLADVMEPEDLARVRAVFVRLIGEEQLRKLESADDEDPADDTKLDVKPDVKPEVDRATASPMFEGDAGKALDSKRKKRMEMVDEINGIANAEKVAKSESSRGARSSKRAKSEPAAEPKVVD